LPAVLITITRALRSSHSLIEPFNTLFLSPAFLNRVTMLLRCVVRFENNRFRMFDYNVLYLIVLSNALSDTACIITDICTCICAIEFLHNARDKSVMLQRVHLSSFRPAGSELNLWKYNDQPDWPVFPFLGFYISAPTFRARTERGRKTKALLETWKTSGSGHKHRDNRKSEETRDYHETEEFVF